MAILKKIISFSKKARILISKNERRMAPWYGVSNRDSLRLDYDLDSTSVVFDLGGYKGQWASDIFAKYRCSVYVFEPVPSFALEIKGRFSKNDKIQIFQFGLAEKKYQDWIGVDGASSSIFKRGNNSEEVSFVKIDDFFKEHKIELIDLMKINIEGGEYSLLEHLIKTGLIKKIKNIQIQFHDFVPNAERRMRFIQKELLKTHRPTYQFKFVWENWELIK